MSWSPMNWLLAKIYDGAMDRAEHKHFRAWRESLLTNVTGDVVEIGAGTGANFSHYGSGVRSLAAFEPSGQMRSIAAKKVARGTNATPSGFTLESAAAESLPCEDDSFDWAVSTLVLCSVEAPDRALSELHRVLRPGGKLAFVEHVLDPHDGRNRRRQRRYQPLWSLVSSTCQVTRDTQASIEASGFDIGELAHERLAIGPSIVRPVIRGWATKVSE